MAHLPPHFRPGLRLARRYLLERPIGAGGMSQVWCAVDEVLGRDVAVKALAAPLAADPVLRSALRREARAAARVAHPNVTQVFDYGEAAMLGGAVVPYLVMELLDGRNLAERLRAGPLTWREAVMICADVAAALAAAHRLGVVHRDVKPGNVMLTSVGIKVVDFGIAAIGPGTANQASAIAVAGTPAYVAPEVLSRSEPTAASDVYALGALLYEALTGAPPLVAASLADAGAAHRVGVEVRPPRALGLSDEVAQLCLRCLSRSPAQRPTSEEVAARLAAELGRPDPAGTVPTGPASGAARAAVGVAPVAVATAAAGAAGNHTLLDPMAGSGASAQPGGDPPYPREGALVAPARDGWLRRPMAVAVVLATVTVLALTLTGVALLLDAADRAGAPGAAGPPATQPTASDLPPDAVTEPGSPEATLAAIESLIAQALLDGLITDSTAADLAGDLRGLREQLDDGRGRSLRKRVDSFRERVEEQAEDGDLDSGLADQLDDLLARLLDLTRARA